MISNLLTRVKCEICLQLFLNLKIVFWTSTIPNCDKIIMILFIPAKIFSQTFNLCLYPIAFLLFLFHSKFNFFDFRRLYDDFLAFHLFFKFIFVEIELFFILFINFLLILIAMPFSRNHKFNFFVI